MNFLRKINKNVPSISYMGFPGLQKIAMEKFRMEYFGIDELTKAKLAYLVCKLFGISHNDLLSKKRFREVNVTPRNVFSVLCREYLSASYKEIGRYLNGKDHSTIIHAVQTSLDTFTTDPLLRDKYIEALSKLRHYNKSITVVPKELYSNKLLSDS